MRRYGAAILSASSLPELRACAAVPHGRAATADRSQEFICKRCGTRFTKHQVLFSFDEHPRYRALFADRNQRRLESYGKAVREIVAAWPAQVPLTRTAVFAQAHVPDAISYTTDRAGLVQIIDAAREPRFRSRVSEESQESTEAETDFDHSTRDLATHL